MKTRWICLMIGCALAAGCVRPLPVRQPTVDELDASHEAVIGLPVPTTLGDARKHLRAYERVYAQQAAERLERVYQGGDTALTGNLVGMAGGLGQWPVVSGLGLLLSTGGSIPEQRYKMTLQADHYIKAADSMRCLQREIATVQSLENPRLGILNNHIDVVRRTLRDRLIAIVPATVDVDALEAAINREWSARQQVANLDKESALMSPEMQMQLEQARLAAFDAQLAQCTAG